MHTRCFTQRVCRLVVAVSVLWSAPLSTQATEPPRPNIILILADDMGFSDLGCYGGEIDTPVLDRLAQQGMRFSQFYNNAKCTTTRASILSGMYPRGKGNEIPRHMPTVAEVLREAGYRTVMSGKWHLGAQPPQRPIDRGFEDYYGLLDGACNYFNPLRPDPVFKGGRVRTFADNDQPITEFPQGYYTTDAFTTHSIETIRRLAANGQPFFLHLAFTAPHYPLHAFPEDIAKYLGRYRSGWEQLRQQRYQRLAGLGLLNPLPELSGTDSKAYDWASAEQEWEDLRMATYAAMVDRLDQNVGRLISALQELEIEDNTLVLFLSDNGGCSEEPGGRDCSQQPGIETTYTAVGPAWGWAQNAPFRRYKSWVHEGGISTPMIAYWPQAIRPGTISAEVCHVIDVLPTLAELAGVEYPLEFGGRATEPLDGRSFAPMLGGGVCPPHSALYWEWAGNCAIRQGPWKLVFDKLNPAKAWELYDIESDRAELHDLAANRPQLVSQLSARYAIWAKATGRALPNLRPPAATEPSASP